MGKYNICKELFVNLIINLMITATAVIVVVKGSGDSIHF